jgi:hypothetical protein
VLVAAGADRIRSGPGGLAEAGGGARGSRLDTCAYSAAPKVPGRTGGAGREAQRAGK